MIKELVYPFDAGWIMQKKKRIKKELLASSDTYVKKNIAILGGYTTNDIKIVLELFLLNNGIAPNFYECEYNQFYQEAVFENKRLEEFKPDIIFVCTCNRNILAYPNQSDDRASVEEKFLFEKNRFYKIWDSLSEKYKCPIIQNNFEMPYYRVLGNKEAYDVRGKVNYLARLNMSFCEYAQSHKDFYICDINYISADFGLKEWSDPFYWHMYKYAVNVNAIPYLSYNVANIIKSIFGKNKKGLVLDLDNTLWGGIIGDDGVEGIDLGPEESQGQVFLEFQAYIAELGSTGVLLNINSKNDEKNALAGLNHPNSRLSEKDFIVIKANWNSKDENFSDIASTLNLLPDSLVFIDDNPVERDIVTSHIDGVIAPELAESHQYIERIDRGGFFETTIVSEDDGNRVEMYRQNAVREQEKSQFSDYTEYLKSLEMVAIIRPFDSVYLSRIAQLTNKSNQFNLTTRRYTQSEIEEISANREYITLYGKLEDKFGDNGVVSVVIGHVIEGVCHIDLWLMSCRVLKRGMEFAMMDMLVRHCLKRDIYEIRGYYYPTQKNHMVEDFYQLQGFELISCDEMKNTVWKCEIASDYINKNNIIMEKE